MPNLLIVANCPSINTRSLLDATVTGASNDAFNLELRVREAQQADANDVLWADGVILGTTENFGYMSGLIKDFLERVYYPCLEKTQGMPYVLYVKGGLDGQGAKASVERIITGLRWKPVQDALVLTGDMQPDFLNQCETLGMHIAAGLDAGIY